MHLVPIANKWQFGVPYITVDLTYSMKGKVMFGGVKEARFAGCSPTLPGFASSNVVIKQVYDRVPSTVRGPSTGGSAKPPYQRILQFADGQIRNLTAEILCGLWADALMKVVYEFIDNHHHPVQTSQERLDIPRMRYVRSALAMEANVTGYERQVFLVEERIDKSQDGEWCRYINNDQPAPIPTADFTPEQLHIAQFLVFCQHVQYVETSGLMFVTDFQGA